MAQAWAKASVSGDLQDVARALEEDIALGYIRPRERLVEDELIARFGVKRHIIRQALFDLEAMGIVVRQPNKGAAVRDFSPREVEELYVVRELVEGRAAELIPLPAPTDLLRALESIHDRHCAAVQANDRRAVFRENLLFHSSLYAACGNASLAQVIEQFAFKTHAIRSYTIGDMTLLGDVCAQHGHMIEALRTGDRARLVELVIAHLQPAKAAYLKLTRFFHRDAETKMILQE